MNVVSGLDESIVAVEKVIGRKVLFRGKVCRIAGVDRQTGQAIIRLAKRDRQTLDLGLLEILPRHSNIKNKPIY